MMSQLNKVSKQINRHKVISPKRIASLTGLDLSAVYRRVYDLRNKRNTKILSESRVVKGRRQTFYRLAG